MVLAVTATGVAKRTCCHPVAVSAVNGAVASKAPPAVQRLPTWVRCSPFPVEADPGDVAGHVGAELQPQLDGRGVGHRRVAGTAEEVQTVHGHVCEAASWVVVVLDGTVELVVVDPVPLLKTTSTQ